MNAKTLRALRASIAHHKREHRRKIIVCENYGPENCALCDLFYENDCQSCPVFKSTRLLNCEGSPYGDLIDTLRGFEEGYCTEEEVRKAQLAEIKFLESLLPKVKVCIKRPFQPS